MSDHFSSRRNFLKGSMLTATGMMLTPAWLLSAPSTNALKILILGGTNFVGPNIVKECLRRKHQVTLLNRGTSNPGLFPKLELIKCDRNLGFQDIAALQNRQWDVVIDVWPEAPSLVRQATTFFKDKAQHYIYISSIAVYKDYKTIGLNENAPIYNGSETNPNNGYSVNKSICERIVAEVFPNQHSILRPHAIVGTHNPDDAFHFWIVRMHRGGELVAPGSGNDYMQLVDVQDVARWTIECADKRQMGIYNLVGPQEQITFKEFLETCKKTINSNATIHWASEAFLRSNQVYSWDDMPLWAPLSEDPGFTQISSDKLKKLGFHYTNLEDTIKIALKWFTEHYPNDYKFGKRYNSAGIAAEREAALIAKWKESQGKK
ncbi:MAG: NAD-dependent epimerase/dehydratase family protein [Saprospiraceae bacterium]|nr:NAD-dependent epimerase/dehydratase family protein [Saprospiraceae bacterium]